MPRLSKLKPHHDANRRAPWRVDIAARFSPSGRRERYFFATKAAAENYASVQRIALANYGVQGAGILPPSRQEAAANAFAALEPYGVSLDAVVADWISRRKASEASISYEAAMDAFLEYRRRSTSYAPSIRQTQNRLVALHGQLLTEITPETLTRALDGMTPSVRNFTIRILRGLFNFGIKRGFCTDNPVRRLDLSQRDPTEIQIHSVDEVAAIMSAAETYAGGLVPFLAVSFFCGIRRAEALRLDWSAIDLHENWVKLPASITKTKRGRHIEISANGSGVAYYICAGQWQDLSSLPGVLRRRLRALGARHGVATIKHGARHSFASYWLAMHDDIDRLCRFLGHANPEVTFRHYAKAATRREAEKFWAIMPRVRASRKLLRSLARKELREWPAMPRMTVVTSGGPQQTLAYWSSVSRQRSGYTRHQT